MITQQTEEKTSYLIASIAVSTPALYGSAIEFLDDPPEINHEHEKWKAWIQDSPAPTGIVKALDFPKPPMLLKPWQPSYDHEAATAKTWHLNGPASAKLPIEQRALPAATHSGPPFESTLIFIDEAQLIEDKVFDYLHEQWKGNCSMLFSENPSPKTIPAPLKPKDS